MSKLNPDIVEAAAEWIVRLDASTANDQTRRDFKTWLQEDPSHGEAFTAAQKVWGELDIVIPVYDVAHPSEEIIENDDPELAVTKFWTGLLAAPTWTKVAGVAACLALSTILMMPALDRDDIVQLSYKTEIGQIDRVTLPDQTTLFINSGAELDVSYSNAARRVTLLAGEAHFDVVTDSNRPFSVVVGDSVVQAIGTAFSVRQASDNTVSVVVTEGRVLLRDDVPLSALENIINTPPDLNRGGTQTDPKIDGRAVQDQTILRAGERVDFGENGQTLISEIPLDRMERDLAWRHGGLIFDRDPLGDVISIMRKYTDADIVILDTDLEALEVGGYFQIGDIDNMLNLLEAGLSVDVERVSEKLIEIRPLSDESEL